MTVPANTDATLYFPAKPSAVIEVDGRRLESVKGVRLVRQDGDRAVIEVGSGSYTFTRLSP